METKAFPAWPDVAADLIETAAGRYPADMVITGGVWVNVHSREALPHIQDHQLKTAWLYQRAHNYGRGLAHQRPQDATYLFGAPRFLWRELLAEWLRSVGGWFRSGGDRFRAQYRYHITRGMIGEYRSLDRESG